MSSVVDWYPSGLLVLSLMAVILSATDAALTLVILDLGITVEANPLMQHLLEEGVAAFVAIKMATTSFGVVIMAAYSQVRTVGGITVYRILGGIVTIYMALIGYELYLLSFMPS